MKKFALLATSAAVMMAGAPAWAQTGATDVRATTATGQTQGTATEASGATSDAQAQGTGAADDIVVTAQRTSERLQDVPISVSAFTGAALETQQIKNSLDLQTSLPNVTFTKTNFTSSSFTIRGIGDLCTGFSCDAATGIHINDVPVPATRLFETEFLDLARIEVLRGPQGTLFGKNASAGVINIVSKQPTREAGGYVEAGYFSRAEYRGRAVVNLPLSEDIRTRFTGFYDNYDGNIRNVAYNGRYVNGFEHYGGRAQLVADATKNVTLTLIADYHHNNDDCCAEVIGTGPLTATGAASTSLAFTVLPTPQGDRTRQINQNLITATKETGYGFSGQIDVSGTAGTITSITAYRNYRNTEIRDGDWLPAAYIGFNQLHDVGPQTGHTFSQELRLTSPGKQFFNYVIGAYYSRAVSERIFTRNDVACTSAVTPAPTVLTPCASALANPSPFPTATADFGSTFKNLALFGQVTIDLLDRFRLIGGLRYTNDQLDVFHARDTTLAGPGIQPSFPVTATGTGAPTGRFTSETNNNNLSGKAGFQFDIAPQSTLYATYARGYKGPAYNVFFNLTATGTNTIAPETSDAYEAGLKNSLLHGRLVLNLAAYYAKYHNFQANNPDLVAGVVVTRFTNAGEVSTRGGEADLIWQPAHDLSVSGGVAYTDAHVNQFFAPPGAAATAIVPAGTPLGFAPKWKGNLGADYRYRSGGAVDVFGGVQGSYQSSELALFAADATQRQLGTIHAYGLVNLSAGVTSADDRWRITGQVRNLFDQSFAAAIANGGPSGSYRYQIPRDADRYYGVTGRVTF